MIQAESRANDPAHDFLGTRQPLDAVFAPKRVAVIGASEKPGSVGRTLLWNLISNPFGGTVYPVNPKRDSILGIKAYASLDKIPDAVDLAIIATPAPTVSQVIKECTHKGVKGAIIISAGFKEIGETGIALEQEIKAQAQAHNLRIVGPNCLGVMTPHYGLNATFGSAMALPGNVGFISQSGALCTSILDWSFRENVGFSAFVSIGSMLDVDWGDLIDYLGDDPNTHSIVIYMESIGDARSFLSAAREVALTKPIIVIKSGRTSAAAQAAASHTGALAGSDDVLDAAFRRCGVLRVDAIDDLFNLAEILAKQPRPKGNRLTILTNAGGPGVLATDALIRQGGQLAPLAPDTLQALNACLPAHWSHDNPIDILGDADPKRYESAIAQVAKDPNSDGLLVILTPQAMTNPTQIAASLCNVSNLQGKPLLASWMGGDSVKEGEKRLNDANIFTLPYPDTAAQVFNLMWRYSYNLQGIYETPTLGEGIDPDYSKVATILNQVQNSRRTLLTEYEAKQLLAAYRIPTVETRLATNAEEAMSQAEAIGYPVVLKLSSETITHKSDVGGVQLNLKEAAEVEAAYYQIQESVSSEYFQGVTVQPMLKRDGYELILGSSLDPEFGPVLLFGTGGSLVEVFQDRALALPPLNTTLARRLMEQTRIYQALQGVRGGKTVDLEALEQLLVQFSQLVVEQPQIKEIEINPLLAASPETGNNIALDARVILQEAGTARPQPAIRPYPTQYITSWQLRDQTAVAIRPIRPEDEPLIRAFHATLSEESVYLRYAHLISEAHRITHTRLTRICFIDYDREIALVADYEDENREHHILGVGRLSRIQGTHSAEFGMLISDRYQGQGLGTELLQQLIQIGQQENLEAIIAYILPENRPMQRICQRFGFDLVNDRESGMVIAERFLSPKTP